MRAALLAEYTASQEAPVIPQIELTLTSFSPVLPEEQGRRLLAAQKSPFDVNAEDPVPLPGCAVGETGPRLRNPGVVY